MTRRHPISPSLASALVVTLVTLTAACAGDPESSRDTTSTTSTTVSTGATTTEPPTPPAETIVLGGQGNHLDAYAADPETDGSFRTQRVINNHETDTANGLDINAQICPFTPDGEDGVFFIAGEDTGQPDPPPGWGIFRLEGTSIGALAATKVGKLTPTYQPSVDGPENYGCGVLSDGRVVTTDVGNQADGGGDGQLIIWFGPFTEPGATSCKLDIGLATAQSILVRENESGGDELLIATARGGVFRYPGPFPTSASIVGGCTSIDGTGAPVAPLTAKEIWLANDGANGMATPSGLAPAPDDGVYVSSVFTGVINEYDRNGAFKRTILQPPEGETLGVRPFSTGTPLGIGVDLVGNLFYADIGVVIGPDGVGPGEKTGTVRRIAFIDGVPQAPEKMGLGLEFPDGIGVISPIAGGGGGLLVP